MSQYNKSNPLRCFFAFEGYNSQGMALDRIKKSVPGFDWVCVGRSEIDKYAIQAANAIYPQYADRNYGDISKIKWDEVPDFDLFTYSFPCTDISNAGQQKGLEEGSGTRSSLLWECCKTIESKRPKYLLMENVKALVSQKFLPFYQKWEQWLAEMGYDNHGKVINATECGVPQNRERIFLVSILDEDKPFHFPNPIPLEKRLKDVLEPEVDDKYVLSDTAIEGFLKHNENHEEKGTGFI
jgi:DNA (cytosine-5)-methyltransferase 1